MEATRMTDQRGNSIAINTRVKRDVYNELEAYLDNNSTISSVASRAIVLGLQVMRQVKDAVNDVAKNTEQAKQ
jgi:phosphotransferase system IIB component